MTINAEELHEEALALGEDLSTPPYYLLRFPALAPGVVGR